MNVTRWIHRFAILSALAFSTDAVAATRYVSPQGSDSANGSVSAPWRTIQRAVQGWKPGDTVLISSGVYRERIEVKAGGT